MDTQDPQGLFSDHLETLTRRWEAALAFAGFDSAIVTAGEPSNYFLDDQAPPLKLNPHFLQWCPSETASGSALLVRPGHKPTLYFLQPDDYWHQPPEIPVWAEAFEVETYRERAALLAAVERAALTAGNHIAFVGDAGADALTGLQSQDVNPALLLNRLHFARAVKTGFELECMREASRKAARGHLAARDAFQAGQSEFQINLAYLSASEQLPAELPYASIVALNEHAGVLHYQHYERTAPPQIRSFLIDAGGSHHGYAADVTRTYAAPGESLFGDLVERMDLAQRALIDSIDGEVDYLALHVDMHRRLADILTGCGLIKGSAEAAFERGLTETFLPHGLGHLIGLQTHDVGGQQSTAEGGISPPPENYPALRLTRRLVEGMPVTIEPGLYFIPQLLDALRQGPHADLVNWPQVESLLPCGGIRIEDNILLRDGRVENLTRDAFAGLDGS
jgi:Xaa-Pro dipeptidase